MVHMRRGGCSAPSLRWSSNLQGAISTSFCANETDAEAIGGEEPTALQSKGPKNEQLLVDLRNVDVLEEQKAIENLINQQAN